MYRGKTATTGSEYTPPAQLSTVREVTVNLSLRAV